MDLFFYRDPEEAKQHEEEEVVATADYGITDRNDALAGEQWTTQIADAQWGTDATVPPPVAAIEASGLTESGTDC